MVMSLFLKCSRIGRQITELSFEICLSRRKKLRIARMHRLATKDQIEQEVDSYEGMGFLKKSKSVISTFESIVS